MIDKKETPQIEEEILDVEDDSQFIDIEVDTNEMTLDDLEMLSLYDDERKVPEWKMTQFLKRVVVNKDLDIGKTKIKEIPALIEAIFAAIEADSEPVVAEKN